MTKQLQYCHSYNRMVKTKKELRSGFEMELRHLASSSPETDLPDRKKSSSSLPILYMGHPAMSAVAASSRPISLMRRTRASET